MSLDQFVACRRAPKLPDDLPEAARWKAGTHEGVAIYTLDGASWLVSVSVEPTFPGDLKEQLADDLADTGIEGATPDDYGILVSVVVEPVTHDEDPIGVQMAVLDMLVETCDGVVMAN
jgi:hypothetical protein